MFSPNPDESPNPKPNSIASRIHVAGLPVTHTPRLSLRQHFCL